MDEYFEINGKIYVDSDTLFNCVLCGETVFAHHTQEAICGDCRRKRAARNRKRQAALEGM